MRRGRGIYKRGRWAIREEISSKYRQEIEEYARGRRFTQVE